MTCWPLLDRVWFISILSLWFFNHQRSIFIISNQLQLLRPLQTTYPLPTPIITTSTQKVFKFYHEKVWCLLSWIWFSHFTCVCVLFYTQFQIKSLIWLIWFSFCKDIELCNLITLNVFLVCAQLFTFIWHFVGFRSGFLSVLQSFPLIDWFEKSFFLSFKLSFSHNYLHQDRLSPLPTDWLCVGVWSSVRIAVDYHIHHNHHQHNPLPPLTVSWRPTCRSAFPAHFRTNLGLFWLLWVFFLSFPSTVLLTQFRQTCTRAAPFSLYAFHFGWSGDSGDSRVCQREEKKWERVLSQKFKQRIITSNKQSRWATVIDHFIWQEGDLLVIIFSFFLSFSLRKRSKKGLFFRKTHTHFLCSTNKRFLNKLFNQKKKRKIKSLLNLKCLNNLNQLIDQNLIK